MRAIEAARCSNFINALPEGVETTVGNRGAKLSPGQRQRIAIAHRLSTLRNFDRIVVLKAGRIIEDGPPQNLMSSGSVYRELVRREVSRLVDQAA